MGKSKGKGGGFGDILNIAGPVVGATIGFVAGGPPGAALGASIGSTASEAIGGAPSGEGGLGKTAQGVGLGADVAGMLGGLGAFGGGAGAGAGKAAGAAKGGGKLSLSQLSNLFQGGSPSQSVGIAGKAGRAAGTAQAAGQGGLGGGLPIGTQIAGPADLALLDEDGGLMDAIIGQLKQNPGQILNFLGGGLGGGQQQPEVALPPPQPPQLIPPQIPSDVQPFDVNFSNVFAGIPPSPFAQRASNILRGGAF